MTATSERLLACAQLIRNGWCQGGGSGTWDGQPRRCAYLAMQAVAMLDADYMSGIAVLRHYLVQAIGRDDVVAWNDSYQQTAENVALGFELAAMLAAQEEPQPAELVNVDVLLCVGCDA